MQITDISICQFAVPNKSAVSYYREVTSQVVNIGVLPSVLEVVQEGSWVSMTIHSGVRHCKGMGGVSPPCPERIYGGGKIFVFFRLGNGEFWSTLSSIL